jgi:DeoR/GlpR family transcriptional regulator of sugar metabolism
MAAWRSPEHGRHVAESRRKKAAIGGMDSAKMHTHTPAAVGPAEMIHALVADAGLAEADREALAARGVQVVIAGG